MIISEDRDIDIDNRCQASVSKKGGSCHTCGDRVQVFAVLSELDYYNSLLTRLVIPKQVVF